MPATVLIVDDHPTFRHFARQLLEEAGYTVVGEAADGSSAVDEARRLAPQIVLLDVMLPDVSGLEVAHELAALVPMPEVVLVSSRIASDFGVASTTTPARRFVAKHELAAADLRALGP